MNDYCRFIASLAEALAENPLRGKYLLAPSHRVGRQWLDQAARVTGGFANARSITVKRLVHDYAEPALRRRNLRVAPWPETVSLIGRALERIAGESGEKGYFTSLPPSLELVETLAASLNELEAANVMSTAHLTRWVTPPEKAEELAKLIRYYRGSRMKAGLAGIGDVHAAAMETLSAAGSGAPLLLLPTAMGDDFSAMEWAFISRWPEESRRLLAEDRGRPCDIGGFTADCVANEAREVLRRIQAEGTALDEVEVVCSDPGSYVPAFCTAGLEAFGGEIGELPITFNSGLPGFLTRPGRLLAAWLEWLEQGLPAEGLARMIESGLLPDGWREDEPSVSPADLAARLRNLPVNGEPEEYRRAFSGNKGKAIGKAWGWLAGLFERIVPLAGGAPTLSDSKLLLGSVDCLLSLPCPGDSRLDAYAKSALLDAVRAWRPLGDWAGFDPLLWLGGLCANLRVMGLGPMPGMLHVGDLASGGHSGRSNTFIVGLDDSRFPGSPRQNPVLLDRERAGISPQLRNASHHVRLREKDLDRLLARLRGRITVSHSLLDAASGQHLFPAAAFAGSMKDVLMETGIALVPAKAENCLNPRDDWLWLMAGRGMAAPTWKDVGEWFPDLANGHAAREARASSAFTEYDGNVPEAGRECDPAAGRVFSPTDLELFATCPMDYFFKRVLGIAPPERYAPTPGRWLEGNRRGSLLHNLFQDFLDRLRRRGETLTDAARERHLASLREMLNRSVADHRKAFPPRDILAYHREVGEMEEAAAIFFLAEESRRTSAEPLYCEVNLGGEGTRTPWDRKEPVAVRLHDGKNILCKGRIDRVDRLSDGGLLILDYKTGASGKFSPSRPFRQGRNLQPYLYSMMLERTLEDLGRPEPVRRFAYFFPMPRDEGRVIAYERADLTDGGAAIMDCLSRMLARGCFPFTTSAGDVEYSDYAPVYGDADALAVRARKKSEADPRLADWAALRGMEE